MSDTAQAEFPSHLVYILRSRNDRERFYVGYTTDLPGRLLKHNRGESSHTAKYAPWEIVWFSAFATIAMPRAALLAVTLLAGIVIGVVLTLSWHRKKNRYPPRLLPIDPFIMDHPNQHHDL